MLAFCYEKNFVTHEEKTTHVDVYQLLMTEKISAEKMSLVKSRNSKLIYLLSIKENLLD